MSSVRFAVIMLWRRLSYREYSLRSLKTPLIDRMNWLDPPVEPPEVAVTQDPESPSEANLNYWTMRLTPLHDPTPRYSWSRPSSTVDPQAGKDMVFVGCNRVGTEEGESCCARRCCKIGELKCRY